MPLNCSPPVQGLCLVQRLRLPASLDSLKPIIVVMDGISNTYMLPLVETLERDLMESLISELNSKFNTGLDSNFSTSRDHPETVEDERPPAAKEDIIAVGSSHLSRTVLSMRSFGDTIKSLATPSWRLTEENVEATAASLAEAVKNNPEATIVYQL